MASARPAKGDKAIRWTTTVVVVVLAGIAAVLSYKHMFVLVRRYGETSWTSALLPVSVDGMIAASSMTLLADSRNGQRSGLLPWVLLIIGSAASLAANVAVAEPSAVGRLIAAWPSCALIGSYELLMRQVRRAAANIPILISDNSHTSLVADHPASYQSSSEAAEQRDSFHLPRRELEPTLSYAAQAEAAASASPSNGKEELTHAGGNGGHDRYLASRRPASGLQRQAWQWAIANRTSAGRLPSGKTIAERFGRRERWGRLVKQAGLTGELDSAALQSEP